MATAKTPLENWITPQGKRAEVKEHFCSWPAQLGHWHFSSWPAQLGHWRKWDPKEGHIKEGPVLIFDLGWILESRESLLSSRASLSSLFVWTPHKRNPDFWRGMFPRSGEKYLSEKKLRVLCVSKQLSLFSQFCYLWVAGRWQRVWFVFKQ